MVHVGREEAARPATAAISPQVSAAIDHTGPAPAAAVRKLFAEADLLAAPARVVLDSLRTRLPGGAGRATRDGRTVRPDHPGRPHHRPATAPATLRTHADDLVKAWGSTSIPNF
jgi:hypothetical protein